MHAKHADRDRLNELSGYVIGCAFAVLNTLGAGFLEKVYENALALELRASGLAVVQQHSARVYYNERILAARAARFTQPMKKRAPCGLSDAGKDFDVSYGRTGQREHVWHAPKQV
jgi:hypothetical protein